LTLISIVGENIAAVYLICQWPHRIGFRLAHVSPTVELKFNLHKEDFFKSEALFKALRQLCICSNDWILIAWDKPKQQLLNDNEFSSYNQISILLLNLKRCFQSLELMQRDRTPFKIGQHIKVGAIEGEVIDVNLRYTVLHAENQKTMVPNSTLLTSMITVQGK